MLHWPPPTPWVPTGPATAGCSLQKSAGLFARSLTTPTLGCENANSAFKSAPVLLSVIPVKQCDGFHAGKELLEQVALVR